MNSRTHRTPASRITALLAVLATVATYIVVSAVPAFASATGRAYLTAGTEVLPGPFAYTLRLEPTQAANLAVITLPVGIGVSIPSAGAVSVDAGLTNVSLQQVGSIQRLILSGTATTTPMNVTINANVATPASVAETAGNFDVAMSADGGRTFATSTAQNAQGQARSLRTVIKFLEIVNIATIAPTAAGAMDGSGTEGQAIRVQTAVRNYLPTPVTVDVQLASRGVGAAFDGVTNAEAIAGNPKNVTVGGNSTTNVPFDVTLGGARNESGGAANRPTTFSAVATEQLQGGTSVSNGTLPYEVQIRGRLAIAGASFTPRNVSPGPATFAVDATHNGTPAFTIDGGSIQLMNGNGTAGTFTIDGNPTFDPAERETLSMTGQVEGEDGDYNVNLLYQATDVNGFTFVENVGQINEPSGALLGGNVPVVVTVDALAPILSALIELPNDAEGDQQTRAKSGDTITVTGTLDDDSATMQDVLLLAGGVQIGTAEASFDNPFDPSAWTATFEDVDFPTSAGTFAALASAKDPAGNLGQVLTDIEIYDNIVPQLISARTERTAEGATGALQALIGDATVISVRFAENGIILSGCNPSQWTVDGQQVVREVRYTDNTRCVNGVEGPDNERLLVLSTTFDRDATPAVRYTPGPAYGDVKDRAGNFALEATVTAVVGIVPALPQLVDVYRNTGSLSPDACLDGETCENAWFDESEGTFYTRFDGNDAVVCVSGGRAGYQVEATDGNGNAYPLTRTGVTGATSCLRVPLNSPDGTYNRGIRYVNSAGVGPELKFKLALDTVAPRIASVTNRVTGSNTLTATFNDKVVGGENFAIDWLVYETLAGGDKVFYSPDSVTTPADANDQPIYNSRTLTVSFRGYGTFSGIGYDYQSGMFGGAMYEDRGGNLLSYSSTTVVPPNAA